MRAKQLWNHVLIGSRWLIKHQNPNGSWIGLQQTKVDAFYKVAWAFMAAGQPAAAQIALNHVQQRLMTADGDFLPRGRSSLIEVHYLYPNAYLVIGSMMAGRYEIAMPGLDFLLSNQDPDHGGFYSRCLHPGHKCPADSMSSSAAGLACLEAGRLGTALRVAEFLTHIIELQPAPEKLFFTTIETEGRLSTELRDDKMAFFRVIDSNAKNQCMYAVGLPFAFLVRLADVTRESRYSEVAQWYLDFQLRCHNPWSNISSGKAGWGCAMLYRITGKKSYRDIALSIANNIISMQNPDGSWGSLRKRYIQPGQPRLRISDFDLTAEFILWLSLIYTNLLAHDTYTIYKPRVNLLDHLIFKSGQWLTKLKSALLSKASH
jgi:hypothetical protein